MLPAKFAGEYQLLTSPSAMKEWKFELLVFFLFFSFSEIVLFFN